MSIAWMNPAPGWDGPDDSWMQSDMTFELWLLAMVTFRRDQVLGTQRAIDAIDDLFEASGGRALATGTYLQRAWRDAHAGRVHAPNDPERALKMYGDLEFGHKIDPGMY